MERTFFIIKPDALERGLVGQILTRIERRGFKIRDLKMLTATEALIASLVNDKLNIPNCPVLIVASSHPFSKSESRYSFES